MSKIRQFLQYNDQNLKKKAQKIWKFVALCLYLQLKMNYLQHRV